MIDLTTLKLDNGGHSSSDGEYCLLEAVSVYTEQSFTDHPDGVSPVLTELGIRLNDSFPDEDRQKLVAFVPRLVGTDDGRDKQRRMLLLDFAIRTTIPLLLETTEQLPELVTALRELAPIRDETTWQAGRDTFAPHREEIHQLANDAWTAYYAKRESVARARALARARARALARDLDLALALDLDLALALDLARYRSELIALFDRMIDPA